MRNAQPFRRWMAQTESTGTAAGAGLGLSIVAAIAEPTAAPWTCTARANGGLRVTLPLPLAGHRRWGRRQTEDPRRRRRQSLADDLAEGLRDQGFAVDAAYDGLEAAAKLDINSYQVVVLDRDLPGIHGDTLCQMISESDNRVMVLMLTAAGAPEDRISGLGVGADDDPPKPFHFPELGAICALARRQPYRTARILQGSRPRARPACRTTARDGRPLDLSVKEFGVLEALLRASPAGLSAEALLEQVWDERADPFTSAVTVTLGRLRRKLGDPPVINTNPGVGYQIAP